MVYPPRLECLGLSQMENIEKMTSHLYMITVPQFKKDGSLGQMLNTCTATLLMYHPKMIQEYTAANILVIKVNESAKLAGVQDHLLEWSKCIRDDFTMRHSTIQQASDATIVQACNQQTEMLHSVLRIVNDLKLQVEALEHTVLQFTAKNIETHIQS
jgi:hypothetical protein